MYQLLRILLPIFPSLVRLRGAALGARGGAGSPVSVRRSSPHEPEAPRLGRALGSKTPCPIISHIISLSPGQQIPINLPSKLFPILDQATSVCVEEKESTAPPHLYLLSQTRTSYFWLTLLLLHPSKQLPPIESENWGPGRLERVWGCFSWETTTPNAPFSTRPTMGLSAHPLSFEPYS